MSDEGYFTSGNIAKMILSKTGTMALGLMVVIIFSIVDTYFVGQLGANELAAVSYTFPIMMLVIGIAAGIGVGSGAVVSKTIGEKKHELVKKYVTHSLYLAAVVVVVLTLLLIATINPMYKFFGAEGIVLDLIKEYVIIIYLSLFLFIVPIVGNYSLRATGDMMTPAILLGTAGVLNGILDWFLIFGNGPFPMMGVKGAAVATFISWVFVFFIELFILKKRDMLEIALPFWRDVRDSWKKVLHIGIPAAGTQLLFPITNAFLLFLIGKIGTEAVAAYGVASRIESFVVIGSMAMAVVMVSFTGQNLGALKHERIKSGFYFSNYANVIFNFIIAIIIFLLAKPLASVFNDDPLVVSYIVLYLMIVPISYGFFGLIKINSSICNGLHKPMKATLILVVKTIVFTVPITVVGMYFFGLVGIFVGIAVSNLFGGIYGAVVVRNLLKRYENAQ